MGLFAKKNKKEEMKKGFSEIPKIPELPELPELPKLPPLDEAQYSDESIPQLPSFPTSSLGEKFSQNTIKEAISGRKEDEEGLDADEFPDEEEMEIMQKPLVKSMRSDYENYEERAPIRTKSREVPKSFRGRDFITKKVEPVFIRIDKFEESMELFEKIKTQVSEIEHLIKNTRDIKLKEEEELNFWESRIQEIKRQVERVDQDIFSKIE